MSHSIFSYLRRRTTEELENILQLYLEDTESELSRAVVKMTVQILYERKIPLPEEYLERIAACLEGTGEMQCR